MGCTKDSMTCYWKTQIDITASLASLRNQIVLSLACIYQASLTLSDLFLTVENGQVFILLVSLTAYLWRTKIQAFKTAVQEKKDIPFHFYVPKGQYDHPNQFLE